MFSKFARQALGCSAALLSGLALACSTEGPLETAQAGNDIALTLGPVAWDQKAEEEWGAWIQKIGEARARKECVLLNDCIKNPAINSLYRPEDASLNIYADCADVPVELRAYFAVRTNRPARWVSALQTTDTRFTDLKYAVNITPKAWSDAREYENIQKMLDSISANVFTASYRMSGEVENGDTYPIDVTREALKPGTVFHDPTGHILLVYKVDLDGTVHLIDGHPGNTLSEGIFSFKFMLGSAQQGGGFRRFRPFGWDGRNFTLATNARLAAPEYGFSADAQYKHQGKDYFDWVMRSLSNGQPLDPVKRFNGLTDQLCIDLQDRAASVETANAVAVQSAASGQLGLVPPNIFGAEGDWELYSTPSRDARFKASFSGLAEFITDSGKLVDSRSPKIAWSGSKQQLLETFRNKWRTVSTTCRVTYKNSTNIPVSLTLADAEARLYNLSFDPYHCPEMRWGAYGVNATEMASCKPSEAHLRRFADERRQRNSIDREYGANTPFAWGPETPRDVNITQLLSRL